MKIRDRDLDKIKLDTYFNNFVWKRGKFNPPSKIKLKASKVDGIVKVDFVDVPESIKFSKIRNEKRHKTSEERKVSAAEKIKPSEEEKTQEEIKDEKEKQQATAQANEAQLEKQAKAEKHMAKVSKDKSSTKQRQVFSRH